MSLNILAHRRVRNPITGHLNALRRRRIGVAGRGHSERLEPRQLLSTTYVVNSVADLIAEDGLLTLREAVYAANSDGPVGDAPAGSGDDVIHFDSTLLGQTITLNGNEIVVAATITILGPGSGQLSIDAAERSRHFEVNPGATLTMSGIRLANGNAGEGASGGSIWCDGSLDLADVHFTQNRAGQDGGAIYATAASASVVVANCVLDGNHAVNLGGGMRINAGELTVRETTFTANSASFGGAISSSVQTAIEDSAFTQNTATVHGGAVHALAPTVVSDTQFSSNSAEQRGGAIYSTHSLTLLDAAFSTNTSDRGGGIYLAGAYTTHIESAAFDHNNADFDGGALFVDSNRAVDVIDCAFRENQAVNSGGAMWTNPSLINISQCAFETNTTGYRGGAIAGAATLFIDGSTFTANQSANGGALETWGPVEISESAFSENWATFGAAVNHSTQALLITRSTFERNASDGHGGAVRTAGSTTILDSTFRLNYADWGGAIVAWQDFYVTTMRNCLLEQNGASNIGGAIYTDQRRMEIVGSTLRENTATNRGGGIFHSDGALAISDSLIASNSATTDRGAGVWVGYRAELTVCNSTLSGNRAHRMGGGVYLEGVQNTAVFINATITANRADVNGQTRQTGGGIYAVNDHVLLQNTLVAGNYAGIAGAVSDIRGVVQPTSSHNLIGDASSAGGLTNGANGNQTGVDPLIGMLQDNGGMSATHAIPADSPAVDAGDNALALRYDGEPLWHDQRGEAFDRMVGLHVDVGAYEYQRPGGEIHGRKWFDTNRDGVADEDVWGLSIARNGSFEQGSVNAGSLMNLGTGTCEVAGWFIPAGVDWIHTYLQAAEGEYSIDLNMADAGSIAQTLLTEPGRRYRVQFAMAGNPDGTQGLKTLRVSAAPTWAGKSSHGNLLLRMF